MELNQEVTANTVKVGIRPNELHVEAVNELAANATVKSVEFLGDEKIVYATFNNGNEVAAIVPSNTQFDMFDTIKITSSNNVLLFDANGANITKNMGELINA